MAKIGQRVRVIFEDHFGTVIGVDGGYAHVVLVKLDNGEHRWFGSWQLEVV